MAKPEKRTESEVKFFKASAPNFIKLKEGQSVEGIFQGVRTGEYGPVYRFMDKEGETTGTPGKIFSLGGNRAQIDQIFTDLMGNPDGFVGDTIIGHYLIVMREPNTKSKAGRKVAVYQVGHVISKCPKGCKAE